MESIIIGLIPTIVTLILAGGAGLVGYGLLRGRVTALENKFAKSESTLAELRDEIKTLHQRHNTGREALSSLKEEILREFSDVKVSVARIETCLKVREEDD